MLDGSALKAIKRQARTEARQRRAAISPAGAGEALAAVLEAVPLPAGVTVSAFLPMGDEIDIRPALAALSRRGHRLALPVTGPRGTALMFRAWAPGEALLPEPFGTVAPAPDAPIVRPDVLLVPLLAFDREGWRLGYGGGYYDRTLAALRRDGAVLAIGIAFSGQEVDAVPHGATDQRLDAVATERGIFFVTPRREQADANPLPR